MSLKDEIKTLSGNKRRFLLLRVTDLETNVALKLVGVAKNTYNSWMQNDEFVALYRRRAEFAAEYKQEAMQLLRRDNQVEAVLLEAKIVGTLKMELETGQYNLIRSHIVRGVYDKLISDLDVVPQAPALQWQQVIQQIFTRQQEQLQEGQTVEGQYAELTTNRLTQAEPVTG